MHFNSIEKENIFIIYLKNSYMMPFYSVTVRYNETKFKDKKTKHVILI